MHTAIVTFWSLQPTVSTVTVTVIIVVIVVLIVIVRIIVIVIVYSLKSTYSPIVL